MEFAYHNIHLYKSKSLGSGSYGGVCKAKCDGLLCAAKIMHPTLFDLRDPGTGSYLRKFQEECHLLSLARHPNVVQYLGTYTDPDTRLPVLLMELCDESLTAFLEQSPGPLSYHIQVNICHDIALALVYLHSNGLIHRDLTGNNVLMIAGPRAKITDFGMSKLASVNPRMTALTMCPGNVLYMSPEALDEAKSYTAKLDIFSFGVIIIQILTRKFPNPTSRFRTVSSSISDDEQDERSEVRQVVPEAERRKAHLELIPDNHPLKPIAIQCLKIEKRRPSAVQISDRLSEMKQYSSGAKEVHDGTSDVQQLMLQLQGQRILTDSKAREANGYKSRVAELEKVIEEKDKEFVVKHQTECIELRAQLLMKERKLQESQNSKEREVKQAKEENAKENCELRKTLEQKERIITNIQETISAQNERIQELKSQLVSTVVDESYQQPVTPQRAENCKDISKMSSKRGKNAPEAIHRGAAVVHGNTVYFAPANSPKVYSYRSLQGEEEWSQLPDNHNENCGLAIVDGRLTSIGGWNISPTNTLLSLERRGENQHWFALLPPMPTPRNNAACATTEHALVVAGGFGAGVCQDAVEVMNTDTKQWTKAPSLPQRLALFTATVCGDMLYLAGGFTGLFTSSKSVFACSLPHLHSYIRPETEGGDSHASQTLWKEINSLPVTRSTLASVGDDLLAFGGNDNSDEPTSDIYKYDSNTDSWSCISQMKSKRSWSFAVAISNNRLIVVGGYTVASNTTGTVEVFE